MLSEFSLDIFLPLTEVIFLFQICRFKLILLYLNPTLMLAEAGRCYAPLNLDFLLGQERISMLNIYDRAVVVAQLAEWLLPIPEDLGSNPVIGNFY